MTSNWLAPVHGVFMAVMHDELLKQLARKYIWWKSPEEAITLPRRIIVQVMNCGDYDDVQALTDAIGEAALREALFSAEPGEFNLRSWHYWHCRLTAIDVGQVPPMPQRRFDG